MSLVGVHAGLAVHQAAEGPLAQTQQEWWGDRTPPSSLPLILHDWEGWSIARVQRGPVLLDHA